MTRWSNGRYSRHPYMGGLTLLIFTSILATAFWLYGEFQNTAKAVEMLSPVPEAKNQPMVGAVSQVSPSPLPQGVTKNPDVVAPVEADNPQKLDLIIGQAVDEFYMNERSKRSELRFIMHCLAHRENGHAANNHCGDSGLACGPFQFHPDTWVRARKAMIADGLATEIGDRYDLKESARTTVFAVKESEKKQPRIKISEWGPILRDMNGSNYASCQKPSWLN